MKNYSGVFFSALVMFAVPALVNYGMSEVCANEVVNYLLVPGATALGLIVWRWSKGDVTKLGVKL